MSRENEAPSNPPGSARVACRLPVGAEVIADGSVHFRTWAPASATVEIVFFDTAGRSVPLQAEGGGYFSGVISDTRAGTRYKIKLEGGVFPDPASRFQPEGPHGPSEIVDPAFAWTDDGWRGRSMRELVIYELHLGTFTPEGTWRAAMTQLPELARLGITMLEIMPIAEFPGEFGWGYDGVSLFAPAHIYGPPADVRAFVNRAHELGLMVILDVVYNHLGPDGNYLRDFSPHYFSARYANEWGEPLNFDGEHNGPVREFFTSNARYWVDEYHFDGLRLDATQQMFDASTPHVLADICRAAREAGVGRQICVIGENETQEGRLVRPPVSGGCGLDALWNDDFHHAALVAATGRAEAYYSGYRGTAQEFVSCAKHGFLYQGQWYQWQKKRRGYPAFDLAPSNFVTFLQNHDQVANSLRGLRLHQVTSAGRLRALTAVLLLSPQIPLLFQGQEFAASAPFLYFADHQAELAQRVKEGRKTFVAQFPSIATPESCGVVPNPGDRQTFACCKLDFGERAAHRAIYDLHRDLLQFRRDDPTLTRAVRVDGAVLGEEAFVLRYFSPTGDDRLLVVNLGRDQWFHPAPEPLLAPIEDGGWRILWSSEAPTYGGGGTPPLETAANWIIPGHAAVLLAPDENRDLPPARFSEKD